MHAIDKLRHQLAKIQCYYAPLMLANYHKQHDISALSPHTALDMCPEDGNSDRQNV
jgi:hypothetical protein